MSFLSNLLAQYQEPQKVKKLGLYPYFRPIETNANLLMARKKRRYHFFSTTKTTTPGTLEFIGERKVHEPTLQCISYNEAEHEVRDILHKDLLGFSFPKDKVNWLDLEGLEQTEITAQIGQIFKLHALLLEDVLNTEHRPKLEEFDEATLIIVKMLSYNQEEDDIVSEHISIQVI